MSITERFIPTSLLVSPDLSSAAKLLWIVLRIDRGTDQEWTDPQRSSLYSPTRLARRTGLSRPTVRKSLAQLAASKWGINPGARFSPDETSAQLPLFVEMPEELVTDYTLHAQARIMYGLLQALPGFHEGSGSFTYLSLGRLARKDPRTVASAVRQLVEAGWLEIHRTGKNTAIHFKLRNPMVEASQRILARIQRRLSKATYVGEALMREYLSLIVDSEEFEDDAAPGFLVNPLTDERMQFDRFYPPDVAFEFNGPQHYGATEMFTEEQAARQRARDLIKTGICAVRGITLIVIHPEDLILETMQRKVGSILPLRDLRGYDAVVEFLESVSRSYRRAARRSPLRRMGRDM